MRELVMVVAVARGGVIGAEGGMPWSLPEDMRHFRSVTTGHAIVMGRKTHVSIGRPLPNRRNIVITRDPRATFEGCESATSLEAALALAYVTDDAPRVVGGGAIYAAAMPLATELLVTEIDRDIDGDTHFPTIDPAVFGRLEARVAETPDLTFVRYRRLGI